METKPTLSHRGRRGYAVPATGATDAVTHVLPKQPPCPRSTAKGESLFEEHRFVAPYRSLVGLADLSQAASAAGLQRAPPLCAEEHKLAPHTPRPNRLTSWGGPAVVDRVLGNRAPPPPCLCETPPQPIRMRAQESDVVVLSAADASTPSPRSTLHTRSPDSDDESGGGGETLEAVQQLIGPHTPCVHTVERCVPPASTSTVDLAPQPPHHRCLDYTSDATGMQGTPMVERKRSVAVGAAKPCTPDRPVNMARYHRGVVIARESAWTPETEEAIAPGEGGGLVRAVRSGADSAAAISLLRASLASSVRPDEHSASRHCDVAALAEVPLEYPPGDTTAICEDRDDAAASLVHHLQPSIDSSCSLRGGSLPARKEELPTVSWSRLGSSSSSSGSSSRSSSGSSRSPPPRAVVENTGEPVESTTATATAATMKHGVERKERPRGRALDETLPLLDSSAERHGPSSSERGPRDPCSSDGWHDGDTPAGSSGHRPRLSSTGTDSRTGGGESGDQTWATTPSPLSCGGQTAEGKDGPAREERRGTAQAHLTEEGVRLTYDMESDGRGGAGRDREERTAVCAQGGAFAALSADMADALLREAVGVRDRLLTAHAHALVAAGTASVVEWVWLPGEFMRIVAMPETAACPLPGSEPAAVLAICPAPSRRRPLRESLDGHPRAFVSALRADSPPPPPPRPPRSPGVTGSPRSTFTRSPEAMSFSPRSGALLSPTAMSPRGGDRFGEGGAESAGGTPVEAATLLPLASPTALTGKPTSLGAVAGRVTSVPERVTARLPESSMLSVLFALFCESGGDTDALAALMDAYTQSCIDCHTRLITHATFNCAYIQLIGLERLQALENASRRQICMTRDLFIRDKIELFMLLMPKRPPTVATSWMAHVRQSLTNFRKALHLSAGEKPRRLGEKPPQRAQSTPPPTPAHPPPPPPALEATDESPSTRWQRPPPSTYHSVRRPPCDISEPSNRSGPIVAHSMRERSGRPPTSALSRQPQQPRPSYAQCSSPPLQLPSIELVPRRRRVLRSRESVAPTVRLPRPYAAPSTPTDEEFMNLAACREL